MARLRDFHKTFAWELVRTNSGSQAYLNAVNETANTPQQRIKASQKAQNLLRNPQVRKYLQVIRDEQRIGVTEIVSEIANIIRFDPLDMLNNDGTVKAIQDMPETARKMIAGLEVSELWLGRGANREQYGVVKKIKFISKMDAIEKAMKHLGGYKEDNDQKKAVTQIAIFQLPDNGREEPRLIDITIGETVQLIDEGLTGEVIEGNRSGSISSEGIDGNRKPAGRGTGVRDNLGSAGGFSGHIQTERDPDYL